MWELLIVVVGRGIDQKNISNRLNRLRSESDFGISQNWQSTEPVSCKK